MRNLYNSILALLLCMSILLSCEKSPMEDTTGLKEVRIAVVLPEKDREPIWNNALKLAAENIRKADIGVKVVYSNQGPAAEEICDAGGHGGAFRHDCPGGQQVGVRGFPNVKIPH